MWVSYMWTLEPIQYLTNLLLAELVEEWEISAEDLGHLEIEFNSRSRAKASWQYWNIEIAQRFHEPKIKAKHWKDIWKRSNSRIEYSQRLIVCKP